MDQDVLERLGRSPRPGRGRLDTSPIIKLFIDEPGSTTATDAWNASDARICCTVGYAEAAVALARAVRMGRIDVGTLGTLVDELDQVWRRVASFIVDDALARDAASHALGLGLRGYDAVHLAGAVASEATLVSGDHALLAAARSVELTITG